MSPPRRRTDDSRGTPEAPPDVDALRARIADLQRSAAPTRAARRGGRAVAADEVAGERTPADDSVPARWWEHEPAGPPRPVVGGIAARTRKGPIGATWWSRRFLESLESVMAGGRVARGRSYARKGQVAALDVAPGAVVAIVQGTRDEPYRVGLRMPVVAPEDWDRIVDALGARAGYAARMLAGELPHEVEEVFEAEGQSLLPAPHARLVTECTCPDWENPCKHVAAVCYLLAEGFDRDPFSLLAWRGRGREEVLGALRARRAEGGDAAAAEGGDAAAAQDAGGTTTDAAGGRGDLLARFWTAGPELEQVRVSPKEAEVPTVALRLAPRGTIAVHGGDLVDVLVPAYRAFAASASSRARH